MPPRKKLVQMEGGMMVNAIDLDDESVEFPDETIELDFAEATHLAVIRERVRNGTADFQDARWLLGILDKVRGS